MAIPSSSLRSLPGAETSNSGKPKVIRDATRKAGMSSRGLQNESPPEYDGLKETTKYLRTGLLFCEWTDDRQLEHFSLCGIDDADQPGNKEHQPDHKNKPNPRKAPPSP